MKRLAPGHRAEKVAEPDPNLRPADKAPRGPFHHPRTFASFLPILPLLWVKPGFSVLLALDGFTQLSLSLTPCDTSIIVITPSPGERQAGMIEQCMPRCGLIWDSCSLSETRWGGSGRGEASAASSNLGETCICLLAIVALKGKSN